MTRAIPEGFHSVMTSLSVDGAAEALELYKKAFGATEIERAPDPSGKKIWHATFRIGDTTVMINDIFPEMGGFASRSSLWIYTEGVDAAWKRATDAGLKVIYPLQDMFWGDRTGGLEDRWGIRWSLAQRMKNLTPAEMVKAQADAVAQMKK